MNPTSPSSLFITLFIVILAVNLYQMPLVAQTNPCEPFEGLYSEHACCPTSCGTCGGPNCPNAPGGPSNCCAHYIIGAGVPCLSYPVPQLAPCVITEPPDIAVRFDGSRVHLVGNPATEPGYQVYSNGEIDVSTPAIPSLIFGRAASSEQFQWVGISFASPKSDQSCPTTITTSPILSGTQPPFSVTHIGDPPSDVIALVDNTSNYEESTNCYQITISSEGNQYHSDPKIYNKRPGEPPKTERLGPSD